MVKIITGTVVKVIGGIYTVLYNNEMYTCSVRTTAKKMRIVVGDYVEIEPNEYDEGKYIIINVKNRKNSIPRPPLANIDKLLIVVAPKPEPDLLLVDKLIIYCFINNIEPIIVINKSDIASNDFVLDIEEQYSFCKVMVVSSFDKTGINELIDYIKDSLSAVCGQSAVGKSSLLNAIIPDIQLETQGLSRKLDRGKHTTRVNNIYVHNNVIIADTPGFSSLELNIDFKELALFYPEFDNYIDKCKYNNCTHIKEGKDCKVVEAVENGKINKKRYLRYCDLFTKLKTLWENKYD